MRKRIIKISILLLILGMVLFGVPKVFPQFYYKNSFQVENYKIHSNGSIDSSIADIIDSVEILLSIAINDCPRISFDVFLCNSCRLFWFHTLLGKLPTASTDLVTNNIYIANSNIEINYAYNFMNKNATSGRSVHSVTTHESMHILLRKKFGFLEYRKLIKQNNWKVEGFCEWIALNNTPIDKEKIQKILKSKSYINNPYHRYEVYRVAVNYLIAQEHRNLDDLMTSKDSFEYVLQIYATQYRILTDSY